MFCYFISLPSEIHCYIFIVPDIFKDIKKVGTYILRYCIRICVINVLRNKLRFFCSS